MNGGAIPDTFTYPVAAEPTIAGRDADEDSVVETMAGDVFSSAAPAGGVGAACVRVEDAHGAPPTAVLARRGTSRTDEPRPPSVGCARSWSRRRTERVGTLGGPAGRRRLLEYVPGIRILGAPPRPPGHRRAVLDEAGGMQLILHAPLAG
jgi:hypothetical protein